MTDPMMPDIDRARILLDGIGWRDISIDTVPGGSVNNTFRLTDGDSVWYLRIGPTVAEVDAGPSWFTGKGLQREQQVIALWSDHQHLLPETVHTDFSHSQVASDWVIQKAIPGHSWESLRSKLSQDQTSSLWRQFGHLIAELHAYTSPEFGPPEPGYGHSRWSELCRWDVTGMLTDAHRYDLPVEPFEQICEIVDKSIHELDEITTPRLIHSDLGTRHVMVRFDGNGDPVISGLIDLEFARFADPYSESIFVAQDLQRQPDPQFEVFLEAYGAERPDRDARIRSNVYQLVAMAWWITDAARRQSQSEIHEIMDQLRKRLGDGRLIS